MLNPFVWGRWRKYAARVILVKYTAFFPDCHRGALTALPVAADSLKIRPMSNALRWLTCVAAVSLLLGMTTVAAADPEPGQPGDLSGLFGPSPGGSSDRVAIKVQFTAPKGGQPGQLSVTAKIAPGYHVYSITQKPGGPIKTKIVVSPLQGLRVGTFQASVEPDCKESRFSTTLPSKPTRAR